MSPHDLDIFQKAVDTFPGALTNHELVKTIISTLERAGYDVGKTLLSTSFCCDELNRSLEVDSANKFRSNFNMGGLLPDFLHKSSPQQKYTTVRRQDTTCSVDESERRTERNSMIFWSTRWNHAVQIWACVNWEIERDGFGILCVRCDRDTNALEGEHSNSAILIQWDLSFLMVFY